MGNRNLKRFGQLKTELKTTYTGVNHCSTFLIVNFGAMFDKFRVVHALFQAESQFRKYLLPWKIISSGKVRKHNSVKLHDVPYEG